MFAYELSGCGSESLKTTVRYGCKVFIQTENTIESVSQKVAFSIYMTVPLTNGKPVELYCIPLFITPMSSKPFTILIFSCY